MPQFPRALYHSALRQYGDESNWTRAALASKRLRMTIRLVAIEETLARRGMGVLPPRVLGTLRLLSDYKESHRRSVYHYRGVAKRLGCDIPFEELVLECSHPRPSAPVVAVLKPGDKMYDNGESLRGFFCSEFCAKQGGRKVVAVLHFDPEPDAPGKRQLVR